MQWGLRSQRPPRALSSPLEGWGGGGMKDEARAVYPWALPAPPLIVPG